MSPTEPSGGAESRIPGLSATRTDSDAGGFRFVGEREVASAWVSRLVAATFESPDGESFERYIYRSPGAVAVVPIAYAPDDHDRAEPMVVLISQYRGAHGRYMIEIPAGTRDVDGEADAENARRELVEEVGLLATDLTCLTNFAPSVGMTDSTCAIFLATGLSSTPSNPQGPEETHATTFEVPLAEAIGWIGDGRIIDAKTVIGLLLADRHLATPPSP